MSSLYSGMTQPIVTCWKDKLARAREARQDFMDRGDQVEAFYSGAAGFMWGSNYMERFMRPGPGFTPPRFQLCFNKSFEYVSLFKPMLFWQMADIKVKPFRKMEVDDLSVLAGENQLMQQYIDVLLQRQATDDAKSVLRSRVQERVLNRLGLIQPDGGIEHHAGQAVWDALIYGAGFLTTEAYQFPGSDKNLVGSFHIPRGRVLVDADCKSPLWSDAGWISIYHEDRVDKVEAMFGYRPGELEKFAMKSSAAAQYGNGTPPKGVGPKNAQQSNTNVIRWHEIFSRAGFGNKLDGGKKTIQKDFDEICGDYVYLCICEDCPWPLNVPADDLMAEFPEPENPDEMHPADKWVQDRVKWPTEFWRHNKWPVSMLSFYPHSGTSAWPEPPMSPCIGELTCANILIATYTQLAYDSRQQFIVTFKNMIENLDQVMSGNQNPVVIELNRQLQETAQQALTFIERPGPQPDIREAIEFIFGLIEKRTGMTDILYGGGGESNARSAQEYNGRRDMVNLRPDYMRKCVSDWMSDMAGKELFCVYSHMGTDDVADDIGPVWALVWQMLVENEDPDVVLRSSECYVNASDMARPNRERDSQMLANLIQYLLPIVSEYMNLKNDPTPLNEFLIAYGDANNMDVTKFLLPMPQEQDPEQLAQQQQQQQLEMQRQQSEVAKLTADAQLAMAQAQGVGQKLENERQATMAKVQASQMAAQGKGHAEAIKIQSIQQTAAQQQALMQQKFDFEAAKQQQSAAANEHGLMLKAATAHHAMDLKEREAAMKAQALAANMQIKQEGLQHAAVKELSQAAMQEDRHKQTMEERRREAEQKLILDVIQGHQKMQQDAANHVQQSQIQDNKATQDAQRNNTIMNQRMLMNAVMQHAQKNLAPPPSGGKA